MDRRKHLRVTLKEPVACTFRIGEEEPQHGYICNVAVMGVLVEVPDLPEKLIMECGQEIRIGDDGDGNSHVFSGMAGVMHWVYKDYIGVGFDEALRDSHEELLAWLEEHDLLIEKAS